jgi:hypothetical protein
MCGISGFSLNPNDTSITNSRTLAGKLLLGIEHRGRDATGACWINPNGGREVQKHAVTATAFVRNLSMWKRTNDAILHTRMWTQGSPENNDNNHPIVVGPVVGVHNGGIWNDNTIFNDMRADIDRIAEVDSEAAFAAIAYGIGRLPQANNLMDCLEQIEGTAALAWYDEDDDKHTLHLARVYGSPLVIAQNNFGSLFFASTEETIKEALKDVQCDIVFLETAVEGSYFEVREGRITATDKFTPAGKPYTVSSSYTSWSKSAKTYSYSTSPTPKEISPIAVKTTPEIEERLFELGEIVEYDKDNFSFDYRVREAQIDNYDISNGRAESDAMGAQLYPGAWVKTSLLDKEYWGQLITIPDSFPEGMYSVRLLVTQKGCNPDVVMVSRSVSMLDWSDSIRRDMEDDIADALHESLVDDAVSELHVLSNR